jgi:hypothetical protein
MPRSTRRASGDGTAKTRKKNASIIVAATDVHLRGAPVVDIASLDALVEIAKKYETMILELSVHEHTEYLIWDDGMVFRFRDVAGLATTPSDAASSPLANLPGDEGNPDDAVAPPSTA